MEDLVQSLKKITCELQEMVTIAEQQHKFRDYLSALVQKRIEDGMIENFDKASPEQLKKVLDPNNDYFKFYPLYDRLGDIIFEFEKIK